MKELTLLIRLQDPPSVSARAVALAREQGAALEVLLVIHSHLYHYGHNDVVVPGKARAGFLAYVSEEIAEQGKKGAEGIRAQECEQGVPVRIQPIMEEDCQGTLQERLACGTGPVLAASTKPRLFPLFKSDAVAAALKGTAREVISLGR
jgi:hypothetical protein